MFCKYKNEDKCFLSNNKISRQQHSKHTSDILKRQKKIKWGLKILLKWWRPFAILPEALSLVLRAYVYQLNNHLSLFALGMWCSLLALTSTTYTQSNYTHRHIHIHPYHTELNSMRCIRKQIINSVGINDFCTFENLLRMFLIIYGNSLKWYNLLFYAIILFSVYSHCKS